MAPLKEPQNKVVPTTEDGEDDYMSMAILEPTFSTAQIETSAQRRARKKREAEARAHQPSKAELARQAELSRDEALNTSLPMTSKGFQMMAKLGFKAGSALGKEGNEHARKEPLNVVVKEGRAGVGMEGEKKRKFREEAEDANGSEGAKRRETEGEFRERQGKEREEKRAEGLCWGAMRVLEGFEGDSSRDGSDQRNDEGEAVKVVEKPTKQIHVLWRGLIRDRLDKERERRMQYDLHQSLSRHAAYDDPEEEKQERQALGTWEEEIEEEDAELDAFNALDPSKRLGRMIEHLRERWRYCFWCKFQYPDERMEGCPGLFEDEHG
ncbi:MAG: hypothetical protein Q9194_000517 [Teloschistes cf. exilis]